MRRIARQEPLFFHAQSSSAFLYFLKSDIISSEDKLAIILLLVNTQTSNRNKTTADMNDHEPVNYINNSKTKVTIWLYCKT